MVDYRRWNASQEDRQALDEYVVHLSAANLEEKASRNSRLAFWINAYNAVTMYGILREYPTSSIRNHTAKVVGDNIWNDLKLDVGGRLDTLNDMEHKILRKMGQPGIHFAIVCASVGCPVAVHCTNQISQRGWLATTKECHSTIVPYARKVRSSTSERL